MHRPSWITGQGVHPSGEVKGVNPEAAGKPTGPQPVRARDGV